MYSVFSTAELSDTPRPFAEMLFSIQASSAPFTDEISIISYQSKQAGLAGFKMNSLISLTSV